MTVRRVFPQLSITSAAPPSGPFALWGDPGFLAAPGRVVQCGRNTVAVQLDPHYTSPGTLVAVEAPGQLRQLLRPGDIAYFSPAVSQFMAYNALGPYAVPSPYLGGEPQLGFLAFLVTDKPAELQISIREPPRQRASLSLLKYGTFQVGDTLEGSTALAIAVSGLQGLRVLAVPCNGLGQKMAAPADLAATIRPWVMPARHHLDTVAGPTPNWFNRGVMNADPSPPADTALRMWIPGGSADLAVTQTARAFDFPVIADAPALGFTLEALAGTGVLQLFIAVEGY
jgi:hypothetical protein